MWKGDPDKLFDFLVDRYALQDLFEVFLIIHNEEAFIKVSSSFTDLPKKNLLTRYYRLM